MTTTKTQHKKHFQEGAFDRQWFKRHQKALLWFANSIFGRVVFRYKKMGLELEKGVPITKITPNSVAQYVWFRGRIQIREHFFVHNDYALKLRFWLYPIWYAMHYWDMLIANRFAPQLNLGFDTLEVNPVGGNTSPCDGYIGVTGGSHSAWSTIHDATSASTIDTTSAVEWFARMRVNGDPNWNSLIRSIFNFDTSALTAGATISAAVMSLYVTAKADEFTVTESDYNIFAATPAATSGITAEDYDQFGTTAYATLIAYASISTSAYNAWTLNSTGRGAINKTGVSTFGFREARYDAPNVDPDKSLNSNKENRVTGNFADSASNKPKLVITYTAVSVPTVTTQAVSSIAITSATGNGNITATGGADADKRGFVWSTSSQSLPGNVAPGSSGYSGNVEASGTFGTGAFTGSLSSLSGGTTYYVRAYAHNSAGYAYGGEVSFITFTAFTKLITETVHPADTLVKSSTKLLTETTNHFDTMTRKANKLLSEVVDATDTLLKATSKTFLETISHIDLFSWIASLYRTMTETIFYTDTFFKQIAVIFAETISHIDTLIKRAGKMLTEIINYLDNVAKQTQRFLTEVIGLIDTLTKKTLKTLSETIIQVDTVLTHLSHLKLLTEAINLLDALTKQFIKLLSETISHVDAFIKQSNKILQETVAHIDTVVKHPAKILNESILYVDSILKSISKKLSDTVIHSDIFITIRTTYKNLLDTIHFTDTVIKQTTRKLVETITHLDTINVDAHFTRVLMEVIHFTDTLFRNLKKKLKHSIMKLIYPKDSISLRDTGKR